MSKETWAEKFDEEFTVDGHGFECEGCCFDESREKVKAFISKVRQEAVLEERRRLSSIVEKKKLPIPNPYGYVVKVNKYNEVIDSIIDLINKD